MLKEQLEQETRMDVENRIKALGKMFAYKQSRYFKLLKNTNFHCIFVFECSHDLVEYATLNNYSVQ